MSFLAAIPIIGQLFDAIGGAIDRNSTTDEERLKFKADMMALQVPVITAVMQAQQAANEMQVKLAELELKNEHWLVWSRRPILAYLSILNLIGTNVAGALGYNYMDPTDALYFALLINGLDTGTRGIEKVLGKMKSKEQI